MRKPKNKTSLKRIFINLEANFIIFRLFSVISDQTEIIKNYVKLKFKASKNLDKSFFDTNKR